VHTRDTGTALIALPLPLLFGAPQAMATWRTEHEVDQLLGGFEFHELPLVRKHYPHFYHKTDRWGRPVYIELLGQCDIDQLLKVRHCNKV
jgi:hypothetical protein